MWQGKMKNQWVVEFVTLDLKISAAKPYRLAQPFMKPVRFTGHLCKNCHIQIAASGTARTCIYWFQHVNLVDWLITKWFQHYDFNFIDIQLLIRLEIIQSTRFQNPHAAELCALSEIVSSTGAIPQQDNIQGNVRFCALWEGRHRSSWGFLQQVWRKMMTTMSGAVLVMFSYTNSGDWCIQSNSSIVTQPRSTGIFLPWIVDGSSFRELLGVP